MPDPLDGLTPAQREAVTHPGGPLLIVAGAGTGKTLTLAERFRWLVSQGHPPEAILALAFSPRAADELRERLEDALDRPYEELAVTTITGFCARLLRDEALEAGLDPFAEPVTPADRLAMLIERSSELAIRAHDFRGNPAALLASFIARIDRLKDETVTAEDYRAWAAGLDDQADDAARSRAMREREFAQLYADHDRMLAERGVLDFGDLVLHAFALLRDKPHVRARVAERYHHVLVDELQDVNFAQGMLLSLLVSEHGNITAAGDDDQAIHRFRGASTKNLSDFSGEHSGATVVRLEHSFRSGRRSSTPPPRSWRPTRTGLQSGWRASPGATCASGAASTSAPRRRAWPPTSSA